MARSRANRIGVAREATWGSMPAPQVMIPVEPPTFSEIYEPLLDNLVRGVNVMDMGTYQGVGRLELSLNSFFFPEETPFFLLAMLGAVVTTGTGPFVHTFSLANQPPSLCLQDEGLVYPGGATSRRYGGFLPSSFGLSFSSEEGFLTWTCEGQGSIGTAPGAGTVPVDASGEPFRGWQGTVQFGGVGNTRLLSADITLERELQLRYAADGLQRPSALHSGAISATCSMVFDATDFVEMDRVLAHAFTTMTLTFTYGAGATLRKLELSIPRLNWGEGPVELDRSGVAVTLSVSGRAIFDRGTGGLVTAVVTNGRTNYNAPV